MKKELMFLSIFFTLLILTSFANAKILVSEPEKIYNLGDKLYLTVTTKPASVSGFFEIKLVCNNESLTIERFIANRFKAGEEQKINIELPLTPQYIQQMRGDCYILASISDEEAATKTFLITDKITIKATLDKKSYDPGETITLKIEAIKANNEPLEGFVEASGIADFSKAVVNGMVTETFTTPETTEAGNYDLNLFLYDIANNQILNHANKTLSIKINQVPQFIQISLSKLEAIPGENFSFGADIFDQAGKKMSGAISISIISPDGEEKHMTINSGEIGSINLATNATAGTWKILASFENVNEEKDFVVKPVQRAKFSFSGPIFTVKNIGNCPYNKTIEIIVGGKKIKKEFSSPIPIGEERKFKIKGPKGEQEVIVSDGSISEKKIIPLTGDVISISELKGPRIFSKSILWAFIILVLLSFGSIIFFRFKNKSVKLRDKIKLPFKRQEQKQEQKQAVEELEPKSGIAESSLVLKGEKNKSAVICIKLKNKLGRNAKEELIKILESLKYKKQYNSNIYAQLDKPRKKKVIEAYFDKEKGNLSAKN